MIESLISPEILETKPWKAFVAGFIFTFTAILLASNVGTPSEYGHGVGFLVIAFISVAAAPFFVHVFKIEEKKEGNIFRRHEKVIKIYSWFFMSVIIASSLFFVMTPTMGEKMFSDQINELENNNIIPATGMATKNFDFMTILMNNLIVLGLAILFSFILGAGAVFLISWNASVIGVLIGKIAENPAAFGMTGLGNNIFVNYLIALPLTLLTLMPHGIFEIGAYFLGAIAGGILSAAIIQDRYQKWEHYKPIMIDVALYAIAAVVLVVIGAAVEVLI